MMRERDRVILVTRNLYRWLTGGEIPEKLSNCLALTEIAHPWTLKTYQYETARPLMHVPMVPDQMITARVKLAPILEQSAKDFHSIAYLGKLVRSEVLELRGEVGDAHLAAFL